MNFDCLSKGVCIGVLVLLVFILVVCGIVIVVCLGGGNVGGVVMLKILVFKFGQIVVVCKGDIIYVLVCIYDIILVDLIVWNCLDNLLIIYFGQVICLYLQGVISGCVLIMVVILLCLVGSSGGSIVLVLVLVGLVKSNIVWCWLVDGVIVGCYVVGDVIKQGVDIVGISGQLVKVIVNGVVVYFGVGLVGYGELIIIKYSDQWLFVYGYNCKCLVNEGQSVKVGEQIVEMGCIGVNCDMVYFEICYNGKLVDLQQYLLVC